MNPESSFLAFLVYKHQDQLILLDVDFILFFTVRFLRINFSQKYDIQRRIQIQKIWKFMLFFLLHAQCVKAFNPKLKVEPEIKHGTNSSN